MVWSTYVNAHVNAVTPSKPNEADRLEPKGSVVGTGPPVCPVVDKQHHRRIERT